MRNLVAALAVVMLCGCGASAGPQDDDGTDFVPPPVVPAVAPDSAPSGPYTSTDIDYDFGRMTVSDEQTGASYETDIHGYIRVPQEQSGPFPVILLQHGRHQTCELGLGQIPVPVGDDNCPDLAPVITPANSYRGYDYLAENLASHGYAVISIDANDINDNDGSSSAGDAGALARGELILRHLDEFRQINSAGGQALDDLIGKLDFSRVGFMGHSCGCEGVAKALALNPTRAQPHNILAVFALAPTDYTSMIVSGATYATLLPYCDGDVQNLMGAYVFDDSRGEPGGPQFQILAMGANHNYFNTVWTSDDWTLYGSRNEPHCGANAATSARDTPEGQRAFGEFFMASFFRYFVGGEADYAAYWTGRSEVPASACPDGIAPCEARYHLSIQSAPQDTLLLDATPATTATSSNALDLPVILEGFSAFGTCTATGADGSGCESADPTFSTADQLVLSWDAPARYLSELGRLDARDYDTLSLRIGVSHGDVDNAGGQDFHIALSDAAGSRAALAASDFSLALFDPPGDAYADGGAEKTTLNAVRIPLEAFSGVDLSKLTQLELIFDQTPVGTVQLTDLMFQHVLP